MSVRLAMLALSFAAALFAPLAWGQDKSIVLASTTSTEQSGLFGHLLPAFRQATGIDVRVVALGTGQALDTARRGDADALFVHDQAAEEKFVADGFALQRLPVMYNDFVLIGPKADPARIKGNDITAALAKLASQGAPFVSPATRAAPTPRSCATGKRPESTLRPRSPPGTRNAAAAWDRR